MNQKIEVHEIRSRILRVLAVVIFSTACLVFAFLAVWVRPIVTKLFMLVPAYLMSLLVRASWQPLLTMDKLGISLRGGLIWPIKKSVKYLWPEFKKIYYGKTIEDGREYICLAVDDSHSVRIHSDYSNCSEAIKMALQMAKNGEKVKEDLSGTAYID